MFGFKRMAGKASERDCERLLTLLTADSDTARSYETLLISLDLQRATPLKTLLVTSAQPQEGKTTVAVNLAMAMVSAGKQVVVLDTDLRRSRVHDIFGLTNTEGLSDVLNGSRVEDVIQVAHISDKAGGEMRTLNVLPSGATVQGIPLLKYSARLKEVIGGLRETFDVVVIDSPPVLAVSDTLVSAPMVDGVILVLNTGVVSEKDARCARDRLAQAGAHLVGVVMNRFDERVHGPAYHPYHRYYHVPAKP